MSETPTYSIIGWNELYENSQSRKCKDLHWVPVPNAHDGEGFSHVMSHKKGAEIFTAFILILQVASKCPERGVLVNKKGVPYTAESLALKTRGNVEWFRFALDFLSSNEVGWIQKQVDNQHGTTTLPAEWESTGSDLGKKEGKNRTEQNEQNGNAFEELSSEDDYGSLISIWGEYQQHRKQKRSDPYTEVGLNRLVSLFKSHAPKGRVSSLMVAVIQKAMVSNWKGLPPEVIESMAKTLPQPKKPTQPVQGIHYDLVTIAGEQVKVIPGSDELFDENAWRSA